MARALLAAWPGELSGIVVVPDGYRIEAGNIEILEASHPVPDRRGQAAAEGVLAAVQGLTADDLVICLISGGGSSLLPAPAASIGLDEKQRITSDLLRSGATISENELRAVIISRNQRRALGAGLPASAGLSLHCLGWLQVMI